MLNSLSFIKGQTMKYYAQFFHRSAIDQNKIIEACGDRAVIILDGRCSREWMGQTAAEECKKRGYVAWQIHRGNFRESSPISGVWYVEQGEAPKNPKWLTAHGM